MVENLTIQTDADGFPPPPHMPPLANRPPTFAVCQPFPFTTPPGTQRHTGDVRAASTTRSNIRAAARPLRRDHMLTSCAPALSISPTQPPHWAATPLRCPGCCRRVLARTPLAILCTRPLFRANMPAAAHPSTVPPALHPSQGGPCRPHHLVTLRGPPPTCCFYRGHTPQSATQQLILPTPPALACGLDRGLPGPHFSFFAAPARHPPSTKRHTDPPPC